MRDPTWVAEATMQKEVVTDSCSRHRIAVYMNLSVYMPNMV